MLTKDTENSMFFGVCAGLARYLGLDATIVRLLTVVSFIMTGSITFWIYIIAAILMPKGLKS